MKHYTIEVENSEEVKTVPEGEELSRVFSAKNSPILFGCRTGICGTCLVETLEGQNSFAPPSEEEKEFLDIIAEGQQNVRLACQLKCHGNSKIKYLGKKG